MIDFIFGLILGIAAAWAYFHYRNNPAALVSDEAKLRATVTSAVQDAMKAIRPEG